MKALILGLPGSGTSYFAGLLSALGWSDAPPTFAIGRYGYQTHESLLGRAVNRVAIGDSEKAWPVRRWHSQYDVRDPSEDRECCALAAYLVKMNDRARKDWYFKNPESLMFFESVWSKFKWDYVIGIYRHPTECMKTMHSNQPRPGRRDSWCKWMDRLLAYSTVIVRFPGDEDRLCDSLGVGVPKEFKPAKGRPRTCVETDPEPWARDTWERLESARWEMETAGT